MKYNEVPEEYKIYNLKISSGSVYHINGVKLNKILEAKETLIAISDDEGIMKSHITDWNLNKELTKEKVMENKDKLLNGLAKQD